MCPKATALSNNFDGLSTVVDSATESLESAVEDIKDITLRLGGVIGSAETLSSEVKTHQGHLLVRLKANIKNNGGPPASPIGLPAQTEEPSASLIQLHRLYALPTFLVRTPDRT